MREKQELPLSPPFYAYAAMTLLLSTPALRFPPRVLGKESLSHSSSCDVVIRLHFGSLTSLVFSLSRGGEGCQVLVRLFFALTGTSTAFFLSFLRSISVSQQASYFSHTLVIKQHGNDYAFLAFMRWFCDVYIKENSQQTGWR